MTPPPAHPVFTIETSRHLEGSLQRSEGPKLGRRGCFEVTETQLKVA